MSKGMIPHNAKTGKDFLPLLTGTGERLIDINERGKDRDWSGKKRRSVKMFDVIKLANEIEIQETNGFYLYSENAMIRIKECGEVLIFNIYKDGKKKLDRGNFCKNKFCPTCNWRKSLKMFGQVSRIVDAILQNGSLDDRYTGTKAVRFIFVTLTQKNVKADELKDELDKMNEGFKMLVQPKKKYAPAAKLQKNLLGYVKAVEITYNAETDTYHPHIHFVGEVRSSYFKDGYIDKQGWKDLWRGVMNLDYDPQVLAKVVKDTEGKPSPGAVAEVSKYPIKVDGLLNIEEKEVAAEVVRNLYKITNHRRMVTFGGDFKEYKKRLGLDSIEDGDLTHIETENELKEKPICQALFKFNARMGVYLN